MKDGNKDLPPSLRVAHAAFVGEDVARCALAVAHEDGGEGDGVVDCFCRGTMSAACVPLLSCRGLEIAGLAEEGSCEDLLISSLSAGCLLDGKERM